MKGTTAVIGAGISGVATGRILEERGEPCVIFEKNDKPGGLVGCDRVEGNLFHRTGGHVFNSRNQDVLNWFWKYFDRDKEFIKAKRNAKIYMGNQYIGYPLENYIYQLDSKLVEKITRELLALFKSGYKDPFSYSSFEDFLLGNFGESLYALYFKPYNTKIWKADLSQVAMEWLEGKLPMPNYENILLSNVLRQEEQQMVHSTFFYPKNEGSQFIIDRLAKGLSIRTNFTIAELKCESGQWYLNGEGPFDRVVYTGDVRMLHKCLQNSKSELNEALTDVKNLRSNSTSNVLCYTQPTDLSWLYLPESNTQAHRIIYTGNFSDSNNGDISRKTCVVEFSGKVDKQTMKDELKNLPGNLIPIAYHYEPNSYVIQEKSTRDKINRLKEFLSPLNFHLSGRFAEWEYYNMDKAIERSLNVVASDKL